MADNQPHSRYEGVHANRDLRIGDHNRVIGGSSIDQLNVLLDVLPQLAATPLHLLPPDVADFTGRRAEIAQLSQLLSTESQAGLIAALAGKPGVGKSALAVHVAHQLAEQFPDGQLYIDLRGADKQTLSAEQALTSLLNVYGVPSIVHPDHPQSVDDKVLIWRRLVAGRRVLLVLDNALDDAQVRPLLPGNPRCLVLITSRTVLATLGAKTLQLDLLDSEQAMNMLRSIVGQGRLDEDPKATLDVIEWCGGLPLALRIAGARLVQLPHRNMAWLAERLAVEHRRLSELDVSDLQVRSSFQLSHKGLPDLEAKAFRRLGLWHEADFDATVVATLLEVEVDEAEEIVDGLVKAQLIEPASAKPGRYRMHDLLRLFAQEQLERQETGTGREDALERLQVHRQLRAQQLLVEQLQGFIHNLAGRTRSLIDRQLDLIDELERTNTDPKREHLFRLDHLATRMRRNIDHLILLSGAEPGRRWAQPIALVEVVRAALAEVEDYDRVELLRIHEAAVASQAVGDVIHLLAELIENATYYSAPNTKVQVASQAVSSGYVIEIEDRGLGMSDEELIEANERLANPPMIDLAVTRMLGLNMVSRLAQRHGIKVQLRHSWYGGVTALTLLPHGLVGSRESVVEGWRVEEASAVNPGEPPKERQRRELEDIRRKFAEVSQHRGSAFDPAASEPTDQDLQRRELEEIRRKFAEMGARLGSAFEAAADDDDERSQRPDSL
jgi:NB-ARC domain